jgi:Flp pilus assembly protein TadG
LSAVTRADARDERGQTLVLFAVVLPLILMMGVITVDVGNWWVHRRHLQTQVDAAALAGGTQFTPCFNEDPVQVAKGNQAIRDEALRYGGDWLRDNATHNLQVQEPGDVRVVLNSATYWAKANGTDPTSGYGLDDSLPPVPPATTGDPCAQGFLDVKATDHVAPLLWGLIPVPASPKRHARVELQPPVELQGVLPWAVPDVDPLAVAAIFVDEDNGEVLYRDYLIKQTLPPGDPLAGLGVWELDFLNFNVTRENIGVIFLVSKEINPPLPSIGSGPPYTCNQAPRRWACYSGGDREDGLGFIHGYDNEKNGTLTQPAIKDVKLNSAGSCATISGNLSVPYFVLEGDDGAGNNCTVGIEAVVDFGTPGCPPPSDNAEVSANGQNLTCSAGKWTGTGVTLDAESGRQQVNLHWSTNPPGPAKDNGDFNKVAVPYVANDDPSGPGDSGPVWYLEMTSGGTFANSLPDNEPGVTVHVKVGLKPPLTSGQLVGLRVSSDSPSSKTQAIDCDKGISMDEEILNGCRTPFALNYKDWDDDSGTPYTWRDIECLSYNPSTPPPDFRYTLPVDAPYNPTPRPDCGRLQTGVTNGEFGKGIKDRFESPCYPMKWNNWASAEEEANDRRWVTLVVTDATAFEGSGGSPSDTIPVKILGAFYVAGWTKVAQANGCPDNLPPPPGVGTKASRGDVWGYFRTFVLPSSGGVGSGEHCTGEGLEVCIPVLIE